MATTIDRGKLKEQLTQLAEQDLAAFKLLITEVVEVAKKDLAEAKATTQSFDEGLNRAEVDAILQRDFERFDEVFRALA